MVRGSDLRMAAMHVSTATGWFAALIGALLNIT